MITPDYYIGSNGLPKLINYTYTRIKTSGLILREPLIPTPVTIKTTTSACNTSNISTTPTTTSSPSPSKFHKYLDNSTCNSSNNSFYDNRKIFKCLHNEMIKKRNNCGETGKRIVMRLV